MLDIDALAVPAQQRADGETVAQIMQARAVGIRRAPQADLAGQLYEGLLEGVLRDSGASLGEEKSRLAGERCASPKTTFLSNG